MIINIILGPAAQLRFEKIAIETGRTIENLVSSAAEEAALYYFRNRKDDPSRIDPTTERWVDADT